MYSLSGRIKHRTVKFARPVLVAAAVATVFWVSAGDLNPPPGAIQPTNRVQLNQQSITMPYTISNPGSYVLTSNLTGDIRIDADDVTLDLNGFTLTGTVEEGVVSRGIGVRNGVIKGGGIDLGQNTSVINVRAISGSGITVGQGSLVKDSIASGNSANGITTGTASNVTTCIAEGNGANGIEVGNGSAVVDCKAYDNDTDGIYAYEGCIISNCTARENGDEGIELTDGSTVRACTASQNNNNGIVVGDRCRVIGNTCDSNGIGAPVGAGVYTMGDKNHIEGNRVTNNDQGIVAIFYSGVNTIIKNSASCNGAGPADAYNVQVNNDIAPITTAASMTSPVGNISN